MTTGLTDQFIAQPDWWITIGREPPAPGDIGFHGAKDCTLEADEETTGLYHLVLGSGGCDSAHREIHVDCDAATSVTVKVVDIDNTHKSITFENSVGAGVAPNQIAVTVRRLTSA